jgi:aminoglycoside phosphotransferase family enzyme
VRAAYNKFMEMDRTVQYVIKMDQMRQNEWEKMMKMQSKICTELKKELDNKITVYKMDTDKKIKECKKI